MNPTELYDSLPEEARDMSKSEFIKRIRELTDPRRIQRDLNQILEGKRTKRVINRAIK